MAWGEAGRFIIIMGNGQSPMLLDTMWGQAWRLSGDRWKAILHSGDVIPARRPPESLIENYQASGDTTGHDEEDS